MPLVLSKPDVTAEFCERALAARLVFELKLEHAESAAARNVGVEVADIDESCVKTSRYTFTNPRRVLRTHKMPFQRFTSLTLLKLLFRGISRAICITNVEPAERRTSTAV